ncbi:MAG: hypothetical protein R3Y05_01235 [bacterium]
MILVILVVSLLLFIVGVLIYDSSEGLGVCLGFPGGLAFFISIIMLIVGCVSISDGIIAGELIVSYETKLEEKKEELYNIVDLYMEYEGSVIDGLTKENASSFIMVIPELKTSELVIEVIYLINEYDLKILEQQTKKVSANVWKWWIYFG